MIEYLKMGKQNKIPQKYQKWIMARNRYHLSHAHIQMARELGLNPDKFGKLANNRQEPWKLPLPQFIEEIYFKHFKKERPDNVRSIEQIFKDLRKKKEEKKRRKIQERELKQGKDVPAKN
jgi:hypothetical protein